VVPRGGLAQSKQINDLSVRGTPESPYTIIRLSAASVQRQDGADPTILNGISPLFRLRKSSIPLSRIDGRLNRHIGSPPTWTGPGKAVDIATDDFTLSWIGASLRRVPIFMPSVPSATAATRLRTFAMPPEASGSWQTVGYVGMSLKVLSGPAEKVL
jgi:hypothetical protein